MIILEPLTKSVNPEQLDNIPKVTQSKNIFFIILYLSLIIACFTINSHFNIWITGVFNDLAIAIALASRANKISFH
tara:strand:+ start:353 stop:580 length:228 start_codon:yes stop_codon:yes gene_type:complete